MELQGLPGSGLCSHSSLLLRTRDLGCVFRQHEIERIDKKIRIRFRENQRWPQLDDVMPRPVRARQDSALAQPIYNVVRLRRRRSARIAVAHQVYTEEQSRPAHVADDCVVLLQSAQSLHQMLADFQRILRQFLLTQNVKHRNPRRARNRIAAKRAEELHPVRERRRNFLRSHNSREWERVPDRFPKHNDVRHDRLRLKSPEMGPEPPETNLDFIRDANSARSTHTPIGLIEIPRWKNNLPRNARQRLRQKRRDLPPFGARVLQNISNSLGILRANPRFTTFIGAAIVIRNRRDVNPRFSPRAAGPIEFIWTQIDQ